MFEQYEAKTTALEISISWFYLGLFLGATGDGRVPLLSDLPRSYAEKTEAEGPTGPLGDSCMTLVFFIGLLIVLFILGVPVCASIGLTCLAVLWYENGITEIPYSLLGLKMMHGINSFPLLASYPFSSSRRTS